MSTVAKAGCWLALVLVLGWNVAGAAPAREDDAAFTKYRQILAGDPKNAAAHFDLGKLYAGKRMRIPAILAYLRFLSLESRSERAGIAAQAVRELLTQGVSEGKGGGTTITISETPTQDELSTIELALSLTAATRNLDENKGKPEIQLIAESLKTVFEIAGELNLGAQSECFPCRQYLPFFLDLDAKGLLEPFTYVALSSLHLPGSAEWLAANAAKVEQLEKFVAKPAT